MPEENNEEQQAPQDQVSHLKPIHHRYWIPILVLAAAVVAYLALAGGYSWWPFEGQNYESGVVSQEDGSEGTGSEDGEGTETAGWRTYTNEEYGFEFNYPENWDIEIQGNGTIVDLNSGKVRFDVACLTTYEFYTAAEPIKEGPASVTIEDNTYEKTEYKINNNLEFTVYNIDLPKNYGENHVYNGNTNYYGSLCKEAGFQVDSKINQEMAKNILGSLKFTTDNSTSLDFTNKTVEYRGDASVISPEYSRYVYFNSCDNETSQCSHYLLEKDRQGDFPALTGAVEGQQFSLSGNSDFLGVGGGNSYYKLTTSISIK